MPLLLVIVPCYNHPISPMVGNWDLPKTGASKMTESNHQHSEHSEHNHEGHNEGHQEQVQEQAPIVETSTVSFKAGDVALPLKHKAGDILEDRKSTRLNSSHHSS